MVKVGIPGYESRYLLVCGIKVGKLLQEKREDFPGIWTLVPVYIIWDGSEFLYFTQAKGIYMSWDIFSQCFDGGWCIVLCYFLTHN